MENKKDLSDLSIDDLESIALAIANNCLWPCDKLLPLSYTPGYAWFVESTK